MEAALPRFTQSMPSGGLQYCGGPGLRPDFTTAIADNGYAWWYVDGLSDDGSRGITIIAQLGSVFSPWYAWARKRGATNPLEHCAMNVALYGARAKAWAMTERGSAAVARNAVQLRIGPSAMQWDGGNLTIVIDEVTAPLPTRLRGVIRVSADAFAEEKICLDGAGQHYWSPIAPRARIEVEMRQPSLYWLGTAYVDCNWGKRPLEADFHRWHWCRASLRDGGTAVLYYVTPKAGMAQHHAVQFAADGAAKRFTAPPECALPAGFWRLPRKVGCEPGASPALLQSFEDAPFYTRSLVETKILGERVMAVHEMLDLDRFDTPWMRMMLPVRAPRAILRERGAAS